MTDSMILSGKNTAIMTLKIAFICSDAIQREILLAQIPHMGGVEFDVHVGNVRTLVSVLQKDHPEVAVLDFPESDPVALQQIKAATLKMPDTHVVLVSPDSSAELLRQAMQAGVRDILPAPIGGAATVQHALDYVRERQAMHGQLPEAQGQLLAFVPVKGGAGATFLATSLAYALSAQDKRVLVVDLNLYFGDAALFVSEQQPTTSVVDLARQIYRMDASLLDTSVLKARDSLHVLAAPLWPKQVDAVTPEALENMLALARSQYDFVILDASRTLDPTMVKGLDLADKIYLTLQLSLPSIQNAKRIITVLQQELGYGLDKLRLVVNRYEKGGLVRLEELERVTQLKVYRTVPNSYEMVSSSVNEGVPLAMLSARDPVARYLQEWAHELSPVSVKAGGRSWLHPFGGVSSLREAS